MGANRVCCEHLLVCDGELKTLLDCDAVLWLLGRFGHRADVQTPRFLGDACSNNCILVSTVFSAGVTSFSCV